jgi:hypothetical protein
VLTSAALLVHLQARLLACVLHMVRVVINMAPTGATVSARHLPVAGVGTDFNAASNSSRVVAVVEILFHGNHAAHFFRVLLALDHIFVTAWQLFFHFDTAIRPARHVALELAGVKIGIAFPLAW